MKPRITNYTLATLILLHAALSGAAIARTLTNQTFPAYYANGNVQLSWPLSAAAYSLYSTTNLQNPVWVPVDTVPPSTNGQLLVTISANTPQRFYRLQAE